MRDCAPEDDLLAELLKKDGRDRVPAVEKISVILTFLIFAKSSVSATLKVFTATRYPMYFPRLTSANPPEASTLPST